MKFPSLDDIQKLKALDLRKTFKSNSRRAELEPTLCRKFMLCWCDTSSHREVEKTENFLQVSRTYNKTRATSNTKQLWQGFQPLDGRAISVIYLRWISFSFTITPLFPHENITTSCWEERITISWNPISSSSKETWKNWRAKFLKTQLM